jgi:L-alanine-DL-glutamate epimerase-like enolase superfamily enzyme
MAVMRRLDAQSLRVRVDANNLWRDADEAIQFLRSLDYPFFAIEEPHRRARSARDCSRTTSAIRR